MKKKVIFLGLWLIVGLLGFLIGMRWSNELDRREEPESKRKSVSIEKGEQVSQITVSKGSAPWDECFQMDISIIEKTLQMLKEEYVDRIETNKLVKGAMEGIKKELESRRLGTKMIKPLSENVSAGDSIKHIKKTYSEILAHYGSKVSESELTYAALKGLMDALNDPYSVALEPKEYKLLNEHMSGGNYGGIGIYIELTKDKKRLTVVEPIEGSPAKKAGLKPGDWITKINGEPTAGMDLELAAEKIRGEIGSAVIVTVQRKNNPPKSFEMQRSLIHVSSVDCEMKPGNIAYIRLRFFGNETDVEFSNALEKMRSLGAKAIIMDLRNNGGGYISAAIDVCSRLLQSGTLIVSVVNERTGRNEVHKACGSDQIQIPLAILVNSLSASASEITAGALKDTNTGILVGERTFGKGSVQTIHELKDGGALKYTIAKYLTPKGIDINKKGIEPNIPVKMEPDMVGTKEDLQMEKAISLLKEKLARTQ